MKFFKTQAAEAAKKDFLIESLVNAGLATEEEIKKQEDPNWLKNKLAASHGSTPGKPSKPTASAGSQASTTGNSKSDFLAQVNAAFQESMRQRRAALLDQ